MISFLVKHVLLVSTVVDPVRPYRDFHQLQSLTVIGFQDEMDVDGDWKTDSKISDVLHTKILSLKLWRHRCIAQANSENHMDIASPVLKMLTTLLQHDGSLSDKINTRYFPSDPLRRSVTTFAFSPSERSRLRLQAAISLAYLSAIDTYAQATTPHFALMALTIQVAKTLALSSVLRLSPSRRIRVLMSVPVS